MKESIRTLDQLPVGGSCVIEQVGNQRGAVKRRLIDMGLTPGTTVELIKTAPFGDPMEVRLRGYELSLRKEDAAQIRVRMEAVKPRERETVSESAYHLGAACHGDCARCAMGCADPKDLEAMHRAHRHEQELHPSAYDPRAHDQRPWKVALVGNPNCGKTTLFNALTGSNQYVGNWPGVTVEKKEGRAKLGDLEFTVVDLPGIYSLSPYSMEELVARKFIIEEQPDAIIDIVDATNLERNLYLTMQLLELERPVALAVNFMDEVEKKGDVIDCARLSASLGVPVVPISARDNVNIDALVQEVHRQMHTGLTVEPDDLYDDFTHAVHHRISELIHDRAYEKGIPAHWASIKLLGGDEAVAQDLSLDRETLDRIDAIAREYEAASPLGDRETLLVPVCGAGGPLLGTEEEPRWGADRHRADRRRGDPPCLGHSGVPGDDAGGVPGDLQRAGGVDVGRHRLVCGGGAVPRGVRVAGVPPRAGVARTAGGRADLRGGGRADLPAHDRAAVPVPLHAGGQRVHGPGGLRHGPDPAALRPERQGVYPHAHGLRVHGARCHGRKDNGEREGPADDHTAGALHVLRGASAHLRADDRRLLPEVRGAGGVRAVHTGAGHGDCLWADSEAERLSRGARALPAGAAALSDADPAEHLAPRVGAGAGLPDEGGDHYRRDERGGVVFAELRAGPPDGGGHGGQHPGPGGRGRGTGVRAHGLWGVAGGGGAAHRSHR